MSRHVRAYRLLLHGYPSRFRMAFGGEMTRLFEDLLEDAGSRRFGVMRLWLRMFADLVASGTHERMEDAMKSHPAMTRAALVVTPIATLIALFAFGGVIALAALTLGLASVGLVWRSLSDAMTPEPQRRWWVMPAIGALLLLAGFGALAMPWSSDVRWPLANMLGVPGLTIVCGSLLRSAYLITRRRTTAPA